MMLTVVLWTWGRLLFTSPDSGSAALEAYRLYEQGTDRVRRERTLYARPDGTSGRPQPSPPGRRDSVFFVLSGDRRTYRYYLIARSRNGLESDPDSSNDVIGTSGLRDTFYALTAGPHLRDLRARLNPTGNREWSALWSRDVGDTALAADSVHRRRWGWDLPPVIHWTELQWRDRFHACRVWPEWYEGGRAHPCPPEP